MTEQVEGTLPDMREDQDMWPSISPPKCPVFDWNIQLRVSVQAGLGICWRYPLTLRFLQ